MKLKEFRSLVKTTYPHAKAIVRAGQLRIVGERSAGERNTINTWAAAAGVTPEARVYIYDKGRRL